MPLSGSGQLSALHERAAQGAVGRMGQSALALCECARPAAQGVRRCFLGDIEGID